jgi:hypothetical protein
MELFITEEGAAVVDNGKLVTVTSRYDCEMRDVVKALFGE